MPLPRSFTTAGFLPPDQARKKVGSTFRRLLIGTEGETDTGKTEWALSAPGPGIVVCLDRGFDALFDNPRPPKTRRNDFGFKVIMAPTATQADKPTYLEHFKKFREAFYEGLNNPDCRTVVIDGDSDSWELQRLAEHGRLTGIYPATKYTDVYAARRGIINRAWDAGKIVIATNKVKAEYATIRDADGHPVLDLVTKEEKREKTGKLERQGFPDQQYLWQIQLRHLYDASKGIWGIKILKAKADPSLVGLTLWGDECNFQSLVSVVYPHVSLDEWGFTAGAGGIHP
jgi:hypothetical protein